MLKPLGAWGALPGFALRPYGALEGSESLKATGGARTSEGRTPTNLVCCQPPGQLEHAPTCPLRHHQSVSKVGHKYEGLNPCQCP